MDVFGDRLLNVCKSTSLRVVNGKHTDGFTDDYRCCSANGYSVIDCILSNSEMLEYIKKYIVCVCSFTEYSENTCWGSLCNKRPILYEVPIL